MLEVDKCDCEEGGQDVLRANIYKVESAKRRGVARIVVTYNETKTSEATHKLLSLKGT
jgi:hypothetical protein